MPTLSLENVQLVRPGGDFRLGPVTMELAAGSRTALVGPSGCGKTTLLRLLAGLEGAAAGTIRAGSEVWTEGRHLRVAPEARGVGFVFQDGALWPHMDAVRHLRFVAPSLARDAAAALLARVGLAGKERRRPTQLSGGEAQRLGLARALAVRPSVLLLDEPLGSVDVHLRDELAALVRSIADEDGLTLVVVTHDRDEALAMADDIVVMRDGRIVEQAPASQMLRAPRTAFSARFLAHAVCLDIVTADGHARTALGPVELPTGARAEEHVLAVLPGDVTLAPATDRAHTVHHVRADSFGRRFAAVELAGQMLLVPCNGEVRTGDHVALTLHAAPRVLPRGES